MDDFAANLQAAAESHLNACNEAEYLAEEGEVDSPAVAPYCGCETCVVREVLTVTYGLIVDKVFETLDYIARSTLNPDDLPVASELAEKLREALL